MTPAHLLKVAFAAILVSSAVARAEDASPIAVTVPKGDKLTIHPPASWKNKVIQPTPEMPPTVKLESPSAAASILITFLPDPDHKFTTKEDIDRAVTNLNKQYVAGSEEKKTTLVQFESKGGHGSYAVFTDSSVPAGTPPKEDHYRMVTSGLFVIGKQAAAITLLSGDVTSADYKEALKVISEGISVR